MAGDMKSAPTGVESLGLGIWRRRRVSAV